MKHKDSDTYESDFFCPSRLWVECLSSTGPATLARDEKKGMPSEKHFPTPCMVPERGAASGIPLRKPLYYAPEI